MPKTYTRLTEDERYQIYEGVTDKLSHRKIASLINRHQVLYPEKSNVTQDFGAIDQIKPMKKLNNGIKIDLDASN